MQQGEVETGSTACVVEHSGTRTLNEGTAAGATTTPNNDGRLGLPKVKKKRKLMFVLIDGLGDVSIPAFDYRTPLQHAKIPYMDYIAAAGRNGLLDPVQVGLACGSDTAHLSIFGYPPQMYVVPNPFLLTILTKTALSSPSII